MRPRPTVNLRNLNVGNEADQKGAADFVASVFTPTHVCEVAAFNVSKCYAKHWLHRARLTLVEPQPNAAAELVDEFSKGDGVQVHRVAITETAGDVVLCCRPEGETGSAYVQGVSSPQVQLHGDVTYHDRLVTVPGVPMSEIDDGTIDYLICDSEGSEWATIKTLASRPAVIQVEMRGHDGYTNTEEISSWMSQHGYCLHKTRRCRDWFFLVGELSNRLSSRAADQASTRSTSGRRASPSSRYPRRSGRSA